MRATIKPCRRALGGWNLDDPWEAMMAARGAHVAPAPPTRPVTPEPKPVKLPPFRYPVPPRNLSADLRAVLDELDVPPPERAYLMRGCQQRNTVRLRDTVINQLRGRGLTWPEVAKALRWNEETARCGHIRRPRPVAPVFPSRCFAETCDALGVSDDMMDRLRAPGRDRDVFRTRGAVVTVMHRAGCSWPEIARVMGRPHSVCVYAAKVHALTLRSARGKLPDQEAPRCPTAPTN